MNGAECRALPWRGSSAGSPSAMDFVFFSISLNINKKGVIINTQKYELPPNDFFLL
jgi:hypothetical protein